MGPMCPMGLDGPMGDETTMAFPRSRSAVSSRVACRRRPLRSRCSRRPPLAGSVSPSGSIPSIRSMTSMSPTIDRSERWCWNACEGQVQPRLPPAGRRPETRWADSTPWLRVANDQPSARTPPRRAIRRDARALSRAATTRWSNPARSAANRQGLMRPRVVQTQVSARTLDRRATTRFRSRRRHAMIRSA